MKKALWLAIAIAISTGTIYTYSHLSAKSNNVPYSYVTKSITTGEIRNVISATGTLAAVDDVIIGAQLSGQITEVFVDFNDKVEAGQLLAQIDPSSFQAKVDQAQAQIHKTQAEINIQKIAISSAKLEYDQAERDYNRGRDLVKKNFLSSTEFEQLETQSKQANLNYQHQQAQLKALEATLLANTASLHQTKIDLAHTEIRSPIDGFIINRTIEKGQTVASSLNTPELFTVAKDLSLMEIEAYIDESDIGQVKVGQFVDFTLDAFTNKKFIGTIKQIRQAPQTNSGVISYTVIINANNPNNIFLPGMTTNLEINIDAARNVQRVDNAALRVAQKISTSQNTSLKGIKILENLNLTQEQKIALKEKLPKKEARSEHTDPMARGMGKLTQNSNGQMHTKMQGILAEILTTEQMALYQSIQAGTVKVGQLLILENNQPEIINVQFGISDSQFTQVISPDLLGKNIITQVKESKI